MKSINKTVFIADGAKVIGSVEMGEGCGVWFNAVIRGDSNEIKIGKNSNIQDNAVIHTGKSSGVKIGDNVTIGHGAIVHGCAVGSNVMIGMGAIVLDGAIIEDNCIIGAGALVTQEKKIPSGSLAFGNPAKVVRQLSEDEIRSIIENANAYVEKAKKYSM